MEKKCIAIFSANYLPSLGGVEVYTHGLACELIHQGYQVTVVTNDVLGLGSYATSDDIKIVRLPCFPLFKGRLPLPKPSALRRRLKKELQNTCFDKVLINTRFYPHSIFAARFAKRNKMTAVILDHGSAYLTFGSNVLDFFVHIWEHLITALIKSYKLPFWGISKASISWLKTFNIQAQGVLPNAIDADKFVNQSSGRDFRKELDIEKNALLICFSGRLVPEKGIEALLQAMQLLKDQHVHLVIAGDGPLKESVKSARSKNTSYIGRLSHPDLAALLIQADLFCLPTRSEGFSTALLEASACATPSLITHVGGVDELILNNEFGTILHTDSSEEIANKIIQLNGNRALLHRQSENISQRVRKYYGWAQAAAQVLVALEHK